MVNYRRNRLAGGTYFFTVNLRERRSGLLVERINLLRESFRFVWERRPFHVDAIVVLPEHIHAIWTLPSGDDDFPARWRAIKAHFTRALIKSGVKIPCDRRGEYRLWQRRYWEHTIRDDIDLQRHVDYVHFNPVKHGHVARVADWAYSSFHRYAREGALSDDWAGSIQQDDGRGYGE